MLKVLQININLIKLECEHVKRTLVDTWFYKHLNLIMTPKQDQTSLLYTLQLVRSPADNLAYFP